MKTLIFDETMFGKIEITFDPNTGNGTAYFHESDIESKMSRWVFHDLYHTQFALNKDTSKKQAMLLAYLPKVIGKTTY